MRDIRHSGNQNVRNYKNEINQFFLLKRFKNTVRTLVQMRNKTAALCHFPDQGSSRYSKKTFINLVKYRSYSGTRSMLTNRECELFLFHPDT